METAIDIGKRMVASGDYRETDGPNRGPAIDHMARQLGFPVGLSWCAIFASFMFWVCREQPGQKFHYTTGSQDLLRWFEVQGLTSKDPQDLLKWKGAIAIRTNVPHDGHGHVAPISGRSTDENGRVIATITQEGNTNEHMSSNGDGAYSHERNVPLHPGEWTFCNTTPIAGGSWWE